MIRSKLGRRVGAALAALLLLVNLALPLAGASANSSNLPSVGWAETVSSFLMSCGIYPFETDENGDYTEWSASSLVPLWNQFKEDVTGVSDDITDLIGFLVNGVLAIASGRWSVLREFASWIVSKFNVADNQTGIQLGNFSSVFNVPLFSSVPSPSDLRNNGLATKQLNNSVVRYYGGSVAGLSMVCDPSYIPQVLSASRPFTFYYIADDDSSITTVTYDSSGLIYSYGGRTVYSSYSLGYVMVQSDSVYLFPSALSDESVIAYYYGGSSSFSGVTADTTTVSIPAELPADTQYGGLTIAGAGAAVTVEMLTEIVQEAVIEGLKPIVGVVGVNLSPDIEINPDTGEITQGEITITPADIDLVASDYQIRQLHTVFPFSIPWDVYNVFSALNAEPVRPYWEVSLTLPGILGQPDTQVPFTIGISDESSLAGPVDDFAALIRNFLLVLMCVATLFGVWRMIR